MTDHELYELEGRIDVGNSTIGHKAQVHIIELVAF